MIRLTGKEKIIMGLNRTKDDYIRLYLPVLGVLRGSLSFLTGLNRNNHNKEEQIVYIKICPELQMEVPPPQE